VVVRVLSERLKLSPTPIKSALAGAALLAVTASSWSISLHVIGMAVITCVAVLTIRDTIRRDNTSPRSRGPCRSVG
jgi:hypothetical protein